MKNNRSTVLVIVAIVLILGIVGVVLALGGSKKPAPVSDNMANMPKTSKTNSSKEPAQSTNAVTISNFAFGPSNITVKVGDTVTWTNQDSVGHTVTSDDGISNGPKSDLIEKGKSYSFTFTKAGTFTYHCTPHPYMKGTVTVTE